MSISEVKFTIDDFALGVIPSSPANAQVKIGVSSGGTINTLYSLGTPKAVQDTLGQGEMVEAALASLSVAGGPILAMPVNPSVAGTASAVGLIGVGTGTFTALFAPVSLLTIEVTTAGTQAAGTIRIRSKLGAGSFTAPYAIAIAGTILIPGTLTRVTFTDGTGFDAGDIFTVSTIGVITQTANPGAGTGNLTAQASSPLDAYSVKLNIRTSGAAGVGTFTYSLDGNNSVSGEVTIPGGGVYAIPNTGIYLTFTGTFTSGDVYSFTTVAASFSNTDVNNALTALRLSPLEFGFIHIVGAPSTSANSASLATVVDAQMVAMEGEFRFAHAIVECPSSESDSTIAAAFASFSSLRVSVCVGDIAHVSQVSGNIIRRNSAWAYSARVAKVRVGEAPSEYARGSLPQIVSLYRDERATPALDAARFTTLRTYQGSPGFYVTQGNMMAPSGSDFGRAQRTRVMDEACRVARLALLPFLNDDVRVDTGTGGIDERDAVRIEGIVKAQLLAAIVATNDATDALIAIDRSTNLLTTSILPVDVRIVPKAYNEQISVTIGFLNPALAA